MPSVDDLKKSKYLKQGDVEKPLLATIDHYEEHDMAPDGQPEDIRFVIFWKEQIKPMSLNVTNGELIAQIAGSRNLDDWDGVQVVLFRDPSIAYAGKIVGGIRVRAPRNQEPVDECPF